MRFFLLHHAGRFSLGKEIKSEFRRYRLCGIILLFMNQALTAVVTLVVHQNKGFEYPGLLIYGMAAYSFYITITAVVNMVKFRRYESPVISAAKAINLVAALVSMLSLTTAMIAQFEGGEDFQRTMTAAVGGSVCTIVNLMAVFMIVRATVSLKNVKELCSGWKSRKHRVTQVSTKMKKYEKNIWQKTRRKISWNSLDTLTGMLQAGEDVPSLSWGVGTLLLGGGLSLVLIWRALFPGAVIGGIGMCLIGAAYPVFQYIIRKQEEKIAPQILRLTEELMK